MKRKDGDTVLGRDEGDIRMTTLDDLIYCTALYIPSLTLQTLLEDYDTAKPPTFFPYIERFVSEKT